MSITYIKHNVVHTTRGVVAQGVNCQGKMNSGVAKDIRATWPRAYERYMAVCDAVENKRDLLGLAHCINVGDEANELFVANCFTQEYYGYDNKAYADIQAVEDSLRYAVSFSVGAKLPLYLPRIGCGLGGLDWDIQVGPALERIHDQFITGLLAEPEIYVCDL